MENKTFKLNIDKKELIVEIRNLAEQANGSVFVRLGQTEILATAVMSKEKKAGRGFFPLTVEYEERYYAAGKIMGSRYMRREGRPSSEATCNARLIDRAIRPLFPENLAREVQVVITVLSWDSENDPDVVGLIAASLALAISDIPWSGPISAVRVGRVADKFLLNPDYKQREETELDIVFAGTEVKDDFLINMIESDFNEADEKTVFDSYEFACESLKKIIKFQKEISTEIGKPKIELEPIIKNPELEKEIKGFLGAKLEKMLYQENGMEEANQFKKELCEFLTDKYTEQELSFAKDFFEKEINRLLHQNILEKEKRPDGRALDEVRKIDCQAGLLPRTHGSSVFSRGKTKALSILTLGAPGDVQLLEGMEIVGKKRFMHHYNFPPYSVGEIKPMRGPGRREIGHGMLAEKALLPLVPSLDQFPYTIRVVTEILSSNGSSSMAAVCAACLALMDAGVPIKRPVAGIAMGLMMSANKDYKILTDIQGPEDHHGEMDFKVAGTKQGLTTIQMDVKNKGISKEIFKDALEKGKQARHQILKEMDKVLAEPRKEMSPFAPRILTIQINPEKIREVIGPGGKVINAIIDECGVLIDIEDSGKVFITAEKPEAGQKALDWIKNITREVKVGELFQGKVKRILDFGAFVEILPGQEGLVHISQLAPERVAKVEDVVKIGDMVTVKVISIDEQNRINLSMKQAK